MSIYKLQNELNDYNFSEIKSIQLSLLDPEKIRKGAAMLKPQSGSVTLARDSYYDPALSVYDQIESFTEADTPLYDGFGQVAAQTALKGVTELINSYTFGVPKAAWKALSASDTLHQRIKILGDVVQSGWVIFLQADRLLRYLLNHDSFKGCATISNSNTSLIQSFE